MSKAKDHIYIRMIEFGISKSDGFSDQEFNDWIKNNNLTQDEKDLCSYSFAEVFKNPTLRSDGKRFLSVETYFKYLDYVELKEARKNSISAVKHSWIAIFLSGFAVIISLIIGYYQLTKPIDLSFKTINEISKVLDK